MEKATAHLPELLFNFQSDWGVIGRGCHDRAKDLYCDLQKV